MKSALLNIIFTWPSFTLSLRSSSLTASKFGESASSTLVVVASLVRDRFRSVVTGDVFETLLRVGRNELVSDFLAPIFLAAVCCSSIVVAGAVGVALVDVFCKGVAAAAVVCLLGVAVVCLVGVAVVCLHGVAVVCLVGVAVVCLVGVACLTGVSGLVFLLLGSAVPSADDNFEAFCLNLQKY